MRDMRGTKLLTVPQMAERLQLHPDAVYRLLREGHLRGGRIGLRRQWRIAVADLDDYWQACVLRPGEKLEGTSE